MSGGISMVRLRRAISVSSRSCSRDSSSTRNTFDDTGDIDPIRRAMPRRYPLEYPCAYFAVYENGRLVSQFMTQVPPGQFSARSDAPEVAAGLSSLHRDAGGALHLHMSGIPWELTMRGPSLAEGTELSGEHHLHPDAAGRPVLQRARVADRSRCSAGSSRELSGAEHHGSSRLRFAGSREQISLRNHRTRPRKTCNV